MCCARLLAFSSSAAQAMIQLCCARLLAFLGTSSAAQAMTQPGVCVGPTQKAAHHLPLRRLPPPRLHAPDFSQRHTCDYLDMRL
jgi:hypothetical protein